jgi:hypothetical protein
MMKRERGGERAITATFSRRIISLEPLVFFSFYSTVNQEKKKMSIDQTIKLNKISKRITKIFSSFPLCRKQLDENYALNFKKNYI